MFSRNIYIICDIDNWNLFISPLPGAVSLWSPWSAVSSRPRIMAKLHSSGQTREKLDSRCLLCSVEENVTPVAARWAAGHPGHAELCHHHSAQHWDAPQYYLHKLVCCTVVAGTEYGHCNNLHHPSIQTIMFHTAVHFITFHMRYTLKLAGNLDGAKLHGKLCQGR